MSASKIFLYCCLSFVGGIFASSFFQLPQPLWLIFLFLAVLLVLLRNKKTIIIGFCLLAAAVGIFLHQKSSAKRYVLNNYGEIFLKAVIVSEPEERIDKINYVVRSKNVSGKILLTSELYPKLDYGDELEIKGELKRPPQFEDFNYEEYLFKDGIYSVIYYPQIEVVSKNNGNIFYAAILKLKNRIRKNISKIMLPPQGGILKAVILGDKYAVSDELKEKMNEIGIRHIISVSGMHMMILSEMFLFLLLAVGLWRKQAFLIVLFLIFLYILMIGAPVSAVRAGVMAGLLMAAQYFSRLRSAARCLVFAAVIMLAFNPLLLKSDAGFQLSFMACLGIIYLKPVFDKLFKKLPDFLKDILSLTFAAQLAVLPLLIYHFGRVSPISPLANLLIVPLLPAIMAGGLLVIFLSFIYLPLAVIVSWPLWLVLTYIAKTADFLLSVWF